MSVEQMSAEMFDALRNAMALHQADRLDEAERFYRHVLRTAPHQAEALQFLGVLMAQRGKPLEAADLMNRAISADPANPGAFYNRGNNRNSFPLFDTPRFARYMEEAYRMMWERMTRGLPPASFAIESGQR